MPVNDEFYLFPEGDDLHNLGCHSAEEHGLRRWHQVVTRSTR